MTNVLTIFIILVEQKTSTSYVHTLDLAT